MTDTLKRTIENIRKNNMECFYAENKLKAREIALSLISKGDTIGVGGSVTLNELDLLTDFRNSDYRFLDRYATNTPEEVAQVFRDSFSADAYFTSSNAVTENGELYNVDGNGNRVAALIHGPKRIIVIVGKNKIVKDLNEAVLRVKSIAAPLNCKRLNRTTPCGITGKCISFKDGNAEIASAGCNSSQRICRHYVTTAMQGNPDRIKVIIVNEDLGY